MEWAQAGDIPEECPQGASETPMGAEKAAAPDKVQPWSQISAWGGLREVGYNGSVR